jgi:hypothetical protein
MNFVLLQVMNEDRYHVCKPFSSSRIMEYFLARYLLFPTFDVYFLIKHHILMHHHIFGGMLTHVACCLLFGVFIHTISCIIVHFRGHLTIPRYKQICGGIPHHQGLYLDKCLMFCPMFDFTFPHHMDRGACLVCYLEERSLL